MDRTYGMKDKESANRILLGIPNICFMIVLKWILKEQDGGVN
jgi:hypothetical protein